MNHGNFNFSYIDTGMRIYICAMNSYRKTRILHSHAGPLLRPELVCYYVQIAGVVGWLKVGQELVICRCQIVAEEGFEVFFFVFCVYFILFIFSVVLVVVRIACHIPFLFYSIHCRIGIVSEL